MTIPDPLHLSPLFLPQRLSFLLKCLADKVISLLTPALPELVKSEVSRVSVSLVCEACPPVGQRWNCRLVLRDLCLL